MDPIDIIFKYYPEDTRLRQLLLTHSARVAEKAINIAYNLGADNIDTAFIREAAMLHDIGIFRCKAPTIYCFGQLPYLCHGIEGAKILREEGLPLHALVCERHTGCGITSQEIIAGHLPRPPAVFLAASLEEKIICAADKYYSKSGDPNSEKEFDEITTDMSRFGVEPLKRWILLSKELHLH